MIELHTIATANSTKTSIMLEECGLEYEVKHLDMAGGVHKSAEYLAMNPVGKMPVIVDHDGAGGKPVTVFETLAIAVYCCDKAGKMMPGNAATRASAWEWAVACVTNLAPALSFLFQLARAVPDSSGPTIEYIVGRADRLFKEIGLRLSKAEYLAGEYCFADVQVYPVAATSEMRMPDGLAPYPNIHRWCDALPLRPAVVRGINVMPPLG